MKSIIIEYNAFTLMSWVTVLDENGRQNKFNTSSSAEQLAKTTIALAYQNNIYNIKISAPSFIYDEIKQQIEWQEEKQYSQNKINIEVI